MRLLIGGEKGGTSKTTLATAIAGYLACLGRDVCLIDADPQASAARWVERRNADQSTRPKVKYMQLTGNVREAVLDHATRFEHLIVDTGGRDSKELRSALFACEVFCTPLRPSQYDYETLAKLVALVDLTREYNPTLRACSVLSIAPTNPSIREVQEHSEKLGERYASKLPLLTTVIRERKVYRDSAVLGLSVVEMGNPLAKAEIEALTRELFGILPVAPVDAPVEDSR